MDDIDDIHPQWQLAYGGSDSPTSDDYGDAFVYQTIPCPDGDDIETNVYDWLLGTQIVFNDIENDGGNLATHPMKGTVKCCVTTLEGMPVGKPHCNPLLDTCQHEIEFEDGTTDQYFANTIAKNLYSQFDSEGHEFLIMKEMCNDQTNVKVESS
ncbi:hypothetical protein ACHAXS_010801 [Conticribra weissflogii]